MQSATVPPRRLRPLHASFAEAGVPAALARLWTQLRAEFEFGTKAPTASGEVERLVGERTPAWIVAEDFSEAVAACDVALHGEAAVLRGMDLVRTLRRLREHADARRAGPGLGPGPGPEPPQPMRPPEGMSPQRLAALVRLCYGEALEAVAALAARRICAPTEVPCSGAQQREMAQLSFDAYCAALWTSAHAEYLAMLDDLGALVRADADADASLEAELMPPPPELELVTSAANAPDLIALYERVASPRACVKSSQTMLALLARATNAGSRGWESAMLSAVKESEGIARVVAHVTAAAFTGLHPCVHPAARPRWGVRFAVGRACRLHLVSEVRGLASQSPGAMKEVMRLYIALLLAEDPATLDALAAAQQPPGQLSIPPRSAAPTALQAAMHAFLAAGGTMLGDRFAAGTSLGERVNAHLTAEPRTRKKASARPAPKASLGTTAPLAYCASWLGGRSPVSAAIVGGGGGENAASASASASASAPAPTAVSVVASVLAASFRGAYLPFWVHAHTHGHRISRLDEPQYNAVHRESPAHALVALLDERATLRAIDAALATPTAPLLSLPRACAAMGIAAVAADDDDDAAIGAAPAAPGGGAARAAYDAEAALLRMTAHDAAMVFVFARVSALRAQALAYDLGPRTRALQLRALARRLRLDVGGGLAEGAGEPDRLEAVARRLPAHATHLYCCTECRRIVNACQDGSGKDVTFNEIGLSASMLRIDCDGLSGGHMRCAKRSSAALRTAVTLEETARALRIESKPPPPATSALPRDVRPATIAELPTRDGCAHTSDIAKMRRDIKNCVDQMPRATACGDVPLVRIPILGRAIRVFGDWYALCSLCGALARIHPDARFGAELCCLRCDYAMLHGKEEARAVEEEGKAQGYTPGSRPPPAKCRFCGRYEIANGGTKFKVLFAPADDGGRNANVPPPLRTVAYCPLHYRPWVRDAHTSMATNVIFAHIATRARPVHGAEEVGGGGGRAGAGAGAGASADGARPPPRSRRSSTKLGALRRAGAPPRRKGGGGGGGKARAVG